MPLRFRTLTLTVLSLALFAAPPAAGDEQLPSFGRVESAVAKRFESQRGYRDGDLISLSQVKPVFKDLRALGWKVADQDEILGDVLSDGHYLVRQLRSKDGQKFMRRISGQPLAYDQLDRLSEMPGGELMIQDFLRFPNADLTFTKKDSPKLSSFARLTPKDKRQGVSKPKDFKKPTGRIYTVELLIDRLKQSYDEEVRRRNRRS